MNTIDATTKSHTNNKGQGISYETIYQWVIKDYQVDRG